MPGRDEPASSEPHTGHRRKNLKHRFEILRSLGQGAYGKVKLAIERDTGQAYAIKTIRKKNISSAQDLARLRREIEIMANLSHPHIIAIYEVFENAEKIVLIMEYASGGELYDHCNDKRGLYDDEARKFFRQIVSAVHYLHMNGIVHRDLKLENIVLDVYGNAKIADFGFANIHGDDKLLSTFCGSPLYASPEIVNGLPYCGPEVDCWSLGVLLYAMVYGAMPFDGSDFRRLRNQITAGDYFKPNRPSDAMEVISLMLHPNPNRRASIEEIACTSWVNYGHQYNPIDDTLPGKPVDQRKLNQKLSQCSTPESDCDVLRNSPVSVRHHTDRTVHDKSHDVTSSPATECRDAKVSTPVIKGILKKPRDISNGTDQNAAGYKRSRSMDLDLTTSVPLRAKSSQSKKPQRPLSSHVPTLVFDSSKKPKKGILKNSRPNTYCESADSACIINDISTSERRDDPEVSDSSTNLNTPTRKHSSGEESQPDGSGDYDLDDIEAVLGSLLIETAEIRNMEKMFEQESDSAASQSMDQASGDSGIVDVSSFESSSVFTEACLQNSVPASNDKAENDSTTIPTDLSFGPSLVGESSVVTSTPNSYSLTSGRRKRSAPKPKSKHSDPTWRYSTGSQGSTSSGDHLDFSYDSADGDSGLSEYFSMPLTHLPVFDPPSVPMSEDKYHRGIDLEVMKLVGGPAVDQTEEEDLGPPPPLPSRPPPDHHMPNKENFTDVSLPQSSTAFDISYNNDDLMEQIMWLENQEEDRIATAERSSSKLDWDEVEDIYQQALKLQKEWS